MRGYSCSAHKSIYENTWGHLAPKANTSYKGILTVARSQFESGTVHLIDMEVPGLDSSPWIYDAITDALFKSSANTKTPLFIEGKCYTLNITIRNYRIWLTNIKELKN